MTFCDIYQLEPIPASVDVICLYITYLSDQVKYTTICNYLSAVWSLHEYLGVTPKAKGTFLVKCTLRGARRLLGDKVLTADPLLPEHLVQIFRTLDHRNLSDLIFWTALVLGYRCLLRKGHFTRSPHMLKRSDIQFTNYGMSVTLRSSKTIQFAEREVVIPVIESKGSLLCPVRWLKRLLHYVRVSPAEPLFPLTYYRFSCRLKKSLATAGIVGNFTSHSLRRGCATYLSRLGLPLHDIKVYGDWRSLSVLLYLSGDVNTRLIKDRPVAKSLEVFTAR